MPKGKKALHATEIALVRQWIAEGAADDTPANAVARYDADHPPVYTRPPVITALDHSPDGKPDKGLSLFVTIPVGSYKPNAFGLYDMHGNVFEWCADWYDKDYYATSPVKDPRGPRTGTLRVIRGGSWYNWPHGCRSAARFGIRPDDRSNTHGGFRVVCSLSRRGP